MATAYSSEVAVGTYNRLRLRVEYSGTSATCYMEFRRTSSYTGSWADTQASITFNGTTVSAPYNYSGTVGTSWVQLCNASGFSVSTSGGTYNWTFNNPGGSSVLGCSGSITIDAQGTAPTGLSLSNVTPGTNQIAATVSVTGWGGLGDANTRFREMSVWEYNNVGGSNRRIQKATGNTLSSTITVTNSSQVAGSLTITPNTKYTLTTFASNGTLYVDQSNTTNTATLATAPTVSVSGYTDTTIVISYSTAADGGAYSKNIQYSLDGSTWTTGATVSSASATSGTYTISGLTAGTTYSIRTRVSTTAGTTTGSTLSQKTAQAPTKPTVSGTSGVTSNTISYGTTSFGYPASGTVYLYGGTSSSPTTQLTSKTSTGTSSYTHSSLTANKRYYYRARAYNGKVYSDYSTEVSVYTKAAAPTVSVSEVTAKTVTIAYSTSADGGAYTKYIDYSLDGTNWTNGATVSSSSATSGTFTITGLSAKTAYSIHTRVRTTAGNTTGQTLSVTTKVAMYGSVSGQTKLVKKFYGSANALGNPPLKGNTTQQTSPNPDYPQTVNNATGEQKVYFHGKNLSPIVTGYSIGTNSGAGYTKTNGTIVVSTNSTGTTLNKGIYMTKSSNIGYCPAAYEVGNTVSFTIVASAESQFAYRNEHQAYNYATIGTTPMRLSFPSSDGNMIFYAKEQNITFTISDFQVEAGSTATAFSPYATLCPINLGKNLFNPAQTPTYINGYATVSQITNGVRVTSTRTSTSTTSAFDSALYAVVRADDYIGKPLSLSIGTMSPSTSGNQRAIIGVCNADASVRESKVSVFTANSRGTYTPTNADRGKYIYVSLYAINGVASPAGSYVDYKNIQFEMNYTITAYTAYLEPIELRKIDTYQDYIHKSGDDWYIHKEIGKRIFDGSENWTFSSTSVYPYRIVISDINMGISNQGVAPKVLTNLYTPKKWNYDTSTEVLPAYCVTATPNSTTLCFRNTDAATLADFKTELTSNNLVTYYLLATPTETKITNSTLISQLNALWSASTYGDDTVLTIGAVDLQAIGTDIFQSTRRIEKFYGSVNNKTKLIYEE